MKQLIIEGQKELTGEIKISGAKNSVVALIPAAILSDEEVTLYNVPNISDTNALIDIIELLNGKVEYIYNLVCSLCEKQKALILKRIRAKQWIKLLEGIINKLGNFQNKQESEKL